MKEAEEAIMYFKFHRKIFCEDHLKNCPKDSIAYQATLKEQKFYDMAIKAIEQESVIDKIRTEIEEIETYDGLYIDRAYVLQIIGKYKVETEEI